MPAGGSQGKVALPSKLIGMPPLDPQRLTKLAESLAIAFYVLMGLAFLAAVFGSPGTGLLLLILGACAHVARVWLEDLSQAQSAPSAPDRHSHRRPT
jgi:hypothetical protein